MTDRETDEQQPSPATETGEQSNPGEIDGADREKLRELVEQRRDQSQAARRARALGGTVRHERVRDTPVYEDVLNELARLHDEDRTLVSVREVAESVDHTPTLVGEVMSILGDEGILTLVSPNRSKTWRIEL